MPIEKDIKIQVRGVVKWLELVLSITCGFFILYILLTLAITGNLPPMFSGINFGGIQQTIFGLFVLILIFAAFAFGPIRKTIGLLLVILGGLVSMTVIGLVIGVPMIIVGGLLLFI